jgi:hypothetical protein
VENEDSFDCGGFDLDEEFGPREASHSKQGACVTASRSHEALQEHTAIREEALQIGRVNIQSDHILEAEPRRVEHLLEIIDRAIELPAEVAGMDGFAVRVDGNLSGTVQDTLATGHFVPLDESQGILPFPRVDNFPFQIFLPGQTVVASFECSATSKTDSPRGLIESQGVWPESLSHKMKNRSCRLGQSRQGRKNVAHPDPVGVGRREGRGQSPGGAAQGGPCVPPLWGFVKIAPRVPPFKRWATLYRPSGTSRNTEATQRTLPVVELFRGTDS